MHPSLFLKSSFQRYAFSVAATAVAFLLTVIIAGLIGRGMFSLAVVAVVLSAWYGGLGPGLLSASLSGAGITYVLLEPKYSFAITGPEELIQLIVFGLVSVLMSQLSEARYRAENELRRRSEQLQAANKELEAFSYSVSHDLRWPLRAIDGYSRILLTEYSAQLPPPAVRYLQLTRNATQQMDQLVNDLLNFSRLGRQPLHVQVVQPSELARQALDDLQAEQENRKVVVKIGELPSCEADPVLLKQVFVNLLQNALKFTRPRAEALIEVGSLDTEQGPAYYVKDNGVGFNMQYAENIFGVFQRLHRSEEYEGTGVGLAIVQRIVQRHGGTIWAEAEVDKGATFFFTLGGARHA